MARIFKISFYFLIWNLNNVVCLFCFCQCRDTVWNISHSLTLFIYLTVKTPAVYIQPFLPCGRTDHFATQIGSYNDSFPSHITYVPIRKMLEKRQGINSDIQVRWVFCRSTDWEFECRGQYALCNFLFIKTNQWNLTLPPASTFVNYASTRPFINYIYLQYLFLSYLCVTILVLLNYMNEISNVMVCI